MVPSPLAPLARSTVTSGALQALETQEAAAASGQDTRQGLSRQPDSSSTSSRTLRGNQQEGRVSVQQRLYSGNNFNSFFPEHENNPATRASHDQGSAVNSEQNLTHQTISSNLPWSSAQEAVEEGNGEVATVATKLQWHVPSSFSSSL